MVRSCYRTNFRFSPDGPLVRVRWYFSGFKPFLPYATSFNSNNWDSDLSRRPIGDQRRRASQHGTDWVEGDGPPPGCCDVPFGTPTAWRLGADGQPTRMSCVWLPFAGAAAEASGAVGSIQVVLAPAGIAAEASGATGSVAVVVNVPGVAAEAETATGSVAVVVNVPGVAAEAETATGQIAVGVQVLGVAAEAETATGAVSVVVQVLGVAAEAETATGAIAVIDQVVGTAAEAETATGAVAIVDQVVGLVAEAETATGDIVFVPGFTNPIITSCFNCPSGTYTYWLFTVSGITGSADCTDQNVSHVLANSPGVCTWFDTQQHPGTTTDLSEFVLITPTTAELLFIDSLGNVQSQYTTTSWSCLGTTNTLTLVGSPSCSGWPGSITLTSS